MHLDENQIIYEQYSCIFPPHGHLLLTFSEPGINKIKDLYLKESIKGCDRLLKGI